MKKPKKDNKTLKLSSELIASEYYDNLALEIKFKEAMNPDSKLNQERMKKAQEDAIKSLINKQRSV